MPHQRRKTPPDLSEGRRGDKARDERRRSENRQRLANAVIYKSTSHDSPFHIVLSDTRIRRQATRKLFDDGMVPLLQAAGQQSRPFWRPRRQVGSHDICAKSVFHPFARRDALPERVLLAHHLRQVVRVRGNVLARVATGKHHFELARSPLEHAGHGSRVHKPHRERIEHFVEHEQPRTAPRGCSPETPRPTSATRWSYP